MSTSTNERNPTVNNYMITAKEANRLGEMMTDEPTADNVIFQHDGEKIIVRRTSWGGIFVTLEAQSLDPEFVIEGTMPRFVQTAVDTIVARIANHSVISQDPVEQARRDGRIEAYQDVLALLGADD